MHSANLKSFIDMFDLKLLNEDVDISGIVIKHAEVNRPGLSFAGFYKHFYEDRVQLVGLVETTYLKQLTPTERKISLSEFFSHRIPCVILGKDTKPFKEVLEAATKSSVPVLSYDGSTTELMSEAIRWLRVELAPRITMHGVLVDVYGEGVLILGESGIGKSETALELVKRGHRLVADDTVEIKRVSKQTLFGSAPKMIRHLIELRGIGIIDVKELYGVGSVKFTQGITLVINLVAWNEGAEYERLGLQDEYINILGNDVVCHTIPIRPGRNLAVICEAAAINYRQKLMGYNVAQMLSDRMEENIRSKNTD